MQIIPVLLSRKLFPDRPAEVGSHIAEALFILRMLQIKIFSVLPFRVLARLLKPLIFIGTVIHNQIHQDMHLPCMRLFQKLVHILQRSETRVNVIIVGNVIALVRQRRDIDRREPDDIDSQIL